MLSGGASGALGECARLSVSGSASGSAFVGSLEKRKGEMGFLRNGRKASCRAWRCAGFGRSYNCRAFALAIIAIIAELLL